VLGDIGKGLSPFPYALIYPQDEHERLLIARTMRILALQRISTNRRSFCMWCE
jgi:hypothetical protein